MNPLISGLNDKVVLITGGASGIGLACAQALAASGAKVVCADLQQTQDLPQSCEFRKLDVSSECPKAFEGFPIALVTAGLMALAFMGFSGLQVW